MAYSSFSHTHGRSIEDVAGFSNIKAGELPWSVQLGPMFKGLTTDLGYQYAPIGVRNFDSQQAFINGQLDTRIPLLFRNASDQLSASIVALAAQDSRMAEQKRVMFDAKLAALRANLEFVIAQGSYDEPLDSRILRFTSF